MPRTTVTTVESYERDDAAATVRFTCDTESTEARLSEREPVTLSVRFLAPAVLRASLRVNPEVRSGTVVPEFDEAAVAAPVDLEVTDDGDAVTVASDALSVRVARDPASVRVSDADGGVLFETQTDDRDVRGDRRVEPLFFDEEEVNNGPRRVVRTGLSVDLAPDERIYGLGEQFRGLERTGQETELWHAEPLGTETERAYKNVPFHLSTRGYGMLVDTTARATYDLGASSTASGTVAVEEDALSVVLFGGPSFADVLETYTAYAGRPPRPPKWSFGVWMSRLGYESREELESVAARLREEELPTDVLHLDPFWMRERHSTDLVWDTEQFPDPEGMIDGLHDDGFRVSVWENPHVPVGTEAFAEAAAEGYLIEDGTGRAYVMDRTCQGDYRGGLVDFTDPDAVDWWQERHRDLLATGVDAFKTDYGEYVPEDAVLANGRSGRTMHNAYPYLYNEAVYEVAREARGDDALLWARSAWTGSNRFPVHWGGDPQTSWAGMAAALHGGLSASLSGFGFWSHDVGGFRGTPSPELYVRWTQFGLLSSHARCHGTTPREPWAFGDEAVENFRTYARLRYRLLPYLYSLAEQVSRTGLPVVRPLLLEFQDDPLAHDVADQFLLGPALLVSPVFHGGGETDVYLPEGEWRDHWTGERHDGGRRVTVDAPLERTPVFVRAGSVVPTRDPAQHVPAGTPAELELDATLASDGAAEAAFDFYDEDADRVVELAASLDSARERLALSLPATSVERYRVEVDAGGLDADGLVVSVNDESLDRVDADPGDGEWTVSEGRVALERVVE
jgi:alpha-D-xyloside xylohydrolase